MQHKFQRQWTQHWHSSSAEYIDEPSQRKNLAHLKWKQTLPKKITLNPKIYMGRTNFWIVLSLLIDKHDISLFIWVLFNFFNVNVLQFSLYQCYTFFFLFFFFLFVVNFVIHWNEKALGSHVFPIPIPPPTSLPTRSLQVLPEHQIQALVSCIQPGPVICFTLDSIHVSMLLSWNIPPSPSPTESKRLFYKSVSLFIFYKTYS